MNERFRKNCPTCGHDIEYASEKEGEISKCPKCKNPVWLSQLSTETRAPSPSTPSAAHGGAPMKTKRRPASLGISILTILILIIGYQMHRLKNEVASLRKAIPTETYPAETLPANDTSAAENTNANRAFVTAERIQSRLNQIADDIGAITAKLDQSVAELAQGAGNRQIQIDTLTTSIEAIVDQLNELELSRTDIEVAFKNLMIAYEQLQQELLTRERSSP